MPTRPADGTPTGIQRLVRRAAVEEAFRRRLLAAPAEVAAADPELTPRERAVLAAVPRAQLAAMIDAVRPAAGIDRRAFVRASSSVLLLGGVALTACPTLTCGGIGPDLPPVDSGARDGGTPDANDTLVIVTDALPDAVVGEFYDVQVEIRGGGRFFGFEITSQALPDGLSLNPSGGNIHGYPTRAGRFDFDLRVASDDQQVATKALTIRVLDAADGGTDDATGPSDGAPSDSSTDA